MKAETIGVVLQVGHRRLKATASKDGSIWRISAAAFPEHVMADRQLEVARRKLAARLLPECERIERSRA